MKIKKNILSVTLFTVCCLLFNSFSSFAQEHTKESTEIHKTRSSATINGLKYYLHTVEKGQTLFAIAKFYGRDVNDIVIDNPEAIDGIKPGQVLRILIDKKKPEELTVNDTSNYIFHKVEKGQTLYSITKQYGVSVEKLRALNPELKDGLKVDQILRIPSSKTKTETAAIVTGTVNTTTVPAGKENDKTQTTDAADRSSLGYSNYKGSKKDQYKIAFFLPFHADEANALDADKIIKGDVQLSNKTNVALEFYEGALLAIDSIKKLNFNAKVFVYDIDDKDSLNILNILKKPELTEMDLMIGPLYGTSFMPVAAFAKEHNIAIVSPFTQVNKILFNNPFVSKVSPSITLEVEQMAHFVVDSFKTQNIILINNLNVKDVSYIKELSFYNAFKTKANADLLKAGLPASDSVREVLIYGGIQNFLNPAKTNVIVMPSNNQSVVTDFISKLNGLKDKYKIVLFGLQNWMNYDNLDFEYLNNLSLHIPSNTFIDYSLPVTQNFIKKYRDTYKTEPDTYVFQGFDVSYCFMSALQQNGSGFLKNLSENNFHGLGTNFSFAQYPSDSGFENKFVYILKYQDYQLIKVN